MKGAATARIATFENIEQTLKNNGDLETIEKAIKQNISCNLFSCKIDFDKLKTEPDLIVKYLIFLDYKIKVEEQDLTFPNMGKRYIQCLCIEWN